VEGLNRTQSSSVDPVRTPNVPPPPSSPRYTTRAGFLLVPGRVENTGGRASPRLLRAPEATADVRLCYASRPRRNFLPSISLRYDVFIYLLMWFLVFLNIFCRSILGFVTLCFGIIITLYKGVLSDASTAFLYTTTFLGSPFLPLRSLP
jgi:hypothetical protein